ncbi:MAG: TerC family protein [Steroidobacteraceae bacterium]
MLDWVADPGAWLAFLTLSVLEIVLGIDNLIFISLLIGKLPAERRRFARLSGLSLAMVTRIALLFSIVWLTRLTQPWFALGDQAVSGRDLVLFCGGLFLLGKSVVELHNTMEGRGTEPGIRGEKLVASHAALAAVQIALIDIVFSLDSVFTAVGLANDLPIMVAAIIVAILVMMLVSGIIGGVIERHPTIKVLALAFLILIGVALIAQAFHFDIPKGYLYFSMGFAAAVELINIRARKRGRR